MIPVVLSGGSGTRLWPLSRKQKPKQFLALFSENIMFQETLTRLNGLNELEAPIVISNHDHRFMVAEQLDELSIKDASIILEPVGRNTAPALAVAAMQAIKNGDDPIMLVLAADHLIDDVVTFHETIEVAKQQAESGKIVTFGIVPTTPNTGYGYIKAVNSGTLSDVDSFVEKPDLKTAQSYLESGNYYWNSGMFMFKASTLLSELKTYSPDIYQACEEAMTNAYIDLDFIRLDRDIFESCPSDSIDYAVMEYTNKAVVVPLDAGWNDVGSWSSIWECSTKTNNDNVIKGDVVIDEVSDSYIHSESRLVAAVGVKDLVIVETADAVMVAHKDKVQDVKNIVAKLKTETRDEADKNRLCYRPWGYYDSIDMGERFQVKRISVKPGASLSLQMHHHRAEHWIVVSGTAEVTCGDKVTIFSENQSTFIPLGEKHRLYNPGKVPLEIIEVQSGSYLGEDDIIRFQDNYRRD
jgi:mannose-1-phosphate guanylyltransferase/mannose-6-phosphate isomerase